MKLAVYLTLCTLSVKLIASWSIEANNSGITQIRTSKELTLANDIFNKGGKPELVTRRSTFIAKS